MSKLMTGAALGALIAGAALAQGMAPAQYHGSDVMGASLHVPDTQAANGWTSIGSVSDLVIDADGEVRAVLVDVGGFLGIGARTVAVGMDEIAFAQEGPEPDDWILVTELNREVLEDREAYDPEVGYAVGYSTGMDHSTATTTTGYGESAREAIDGAVAATSEAIDRAGEAIDGAIDSARAEIDEMTASEQPAMRPAMPSADELRGAQVDDATGETVGSIADLLLREDGAIDAALIDVGGVMGVGSHRVALPFERLSVMEEVDGGAIRVLVDATEEQLLEMPEYEG
ncbi:MAG: PRC-barrel domain-containing protein [Rubrimonas sp.]